MKELNKFQKQFFEALKNIQEEEIVASLYGKNNYCSVEEQLHDVTYGVIYRIMEMIDGYNEQIGRLDVIREETGEHLKNNPFDYGAFEIIDSKVKNLNLKYFSKKADKSITVLVYMLLPNDNTIVTVEA